MTIDMTLPERCMVKHPTKGEAVMVVRGERGYYELENRIDPNAYNQERGVTPAQREAMQIGSLFGWDVPGARAETWAHRPCPVTI